MSDSDEIAELKNRIAFLERELGTSYGAACFEREVNRVFPEDSDIDVRDGDFGYFARVTDINGNDVQYAIDKIPEERRSVIETSDGIGMEVWQEPKF